MQYRSKCNRRKCVDFHVEPFRRVEGGDAQSVAYGQAVRIMLRRGGRAGEGALLVRQRDGDKLVRPPATQKSIQAKAVMIDPVRTCDLPSLS
jgi:hypothetical protein